MKGFVFDVDNTLFDRYATITKAITEDFERVRPYINPAYDAARAAAHLCSAEALNIYLFDWHFIYAKLTSENFFNLDRIPSYEQASGFMREWFGKTAVPLPYAEQLLKDIKAAGYKLGVITNGPDDFQKNKLRMIGVLDLFDDVLTSGAFAEQCGVSDPRDLRIRKPGREIFDEEARRLGEDSGELYYVGDSPINDYVGAKKAGYVPVWLSVRSPWPQIGEPTPEIWFPALEGVRGLI